MFHNKIHLYTVFHNKIPLYTVFHNKIHLYSVSHNKIHLYSVFHNKGAQWLSGRVLDLRPKGSWFEPHQRHCVVVLGQDTFILA